MGTSPSTPLKAGKAYYEELFGPPPGKFVQTTLGSTHYILEGESDGGPLVILQHDIGGSTAVFDSLAKNLVKKGFRVLRYDLYDHGYSETDSTRYPIRNNDHPLPMDLKLHVQQLRDILFALELENVDCCSCGHGIGGMIGIGFAAAHPDTIKGLVLINAACLPRKKPLGDECWVKLMGPGAAFRDFSQNSCKYTGQQILRIPQMQELVNKQCQNAMENVRFSAALASTNLHCGSASAEKDFRLCCAYRIPIHLIWGKADTWLPYAQHSAKLRHIATDICTEVTEDSFRDVPHNFFIDSVKRKERSESIRNFASQCLR
jgi:pimeloyl-ACP methyl ester carboxylesterase